jgi:hypothetical protein
LSNVPMRGASSEPRGSGNGVREVFARPSPKSNHDIRLVVGETP